MKQVFSAITIIGLGYFLFTGCKKSDSTPSTPVVTTVDSTFIKSLAASCVNPFTGIGDSGTFALPTAFTPNGDGVNDIYKLMGLHQSFTSYLITIYKQNGTKVFQTTNATTAWAGLDTTGAKCTDYKYYVKIKYTTPALHSVDTGAYLFLLASDTVHHCVTRVYADTVNYKFPDQYNVMSSTFSYPTNELFCN